MLQLFNPPRAAEAGGYFAYAYLIIYVAPEMGELLWMWVAALLLWGSLWLLCWGNKHFPRKSKRFPKLTLTYPVPQLTYPVPGWVVWLTVAAVWGGMAFVLATDTERRDQDRYYALEQMAGRGEWEPLRAEARSLMSEMPQALPFALLAESEMGTLPQHLFSYPVTSADQFVYRRKFSMMTCRFNALFYLHLGYPDEAMHQSFEACTLSRRGLTLRGLRLYVESALQTGDTALAARYIEVMEHVPTMGGEAAAYRERLRAQAHGQQARPRPLRSRNFVGSVPLDHEWVYALDADSTNRKLFDYLACAFLLQKRPEKMVRLMEMSTLYEHRPLPAPYAEAMALFAPARPEWAERFQLPADAVARWQECLQLRQQNRLNEVSTRFPGTYWRYLFLAPEPRPRN